MKQIRMFVLVAAFIFAASALSAQVPQTPRVVDVKTTDLAAAKPGSAFHECPDCPEMVVIPGGSFTMGSSDSEKSWAATHGANAESVSDESPQHNVSLRSFALGKYDVTRGEYAAFGHSRKESRRLPRRHHGISRCEDAAVK
jgi:formylglycine-generating enzyme required for sulfatase activity